TLSSLTTSLPRSSLSCALQLPVSLVLRLWDIYLLEGEKILIAMAYNILKMHKKRLLRMDQTQITCFFQDDLAKDFQFEDDVAIESLKECLEQLRRNKLDQLPPLTSDMLPRRSVGSLGPESVWQSQPNLRIHDTSDDDIHGPTMKPVLSVSTTDRHLRPRKREFTVRDVCLSPIPQRGPLKSQPISPVSLSFSSPGFARPASILTAAAVRNRYRTGRSADVIPQTASHSAPSDDLSNSRSPSASTTSSAFLSDTNYVPRQGSYPARSSPKFLRPRISNNQSRFFLDNQFSPTTSTSTSGYATTEGRRHRALKDSVMNSPTPSIDIPSSFASTTTSSSRDRTLEPPQRSTPEPVNGVTLISVRPRQTADGQVVSQAVTKAFERIYVTKPPIAPHVSNGQVGQWSSSERTLYADPSTTHPPPSPLSYSASSTSEQPWHRHPISVFRSESGHRASPTFGIGGIQQNRIRNTGVSRVELSTSQTREILIPVSQGSSSRPRVLRVDSFGRPLGMTNEVSPTESHLNQEPSRTPTVSDNLSCPISEPSTPCRHIAIPPALVMFARPSSTPVLEPVALPPHSQAPPGINTDGAMMSG
ncbi:Ubiquitin carboxyl-terminal hydrolase 6, partial [Fasciola gigantica]